MNKYTCNKCGGKCALRHPCEVFYDISLECAGSGKILASSIERELILDDLYGHYDTHLVCEQCGERQGNAAGLAFDLEAAYMMLEDDATINAAFPFEIAHTINASHLENVRMECKENTAHDAFLLMFISNWMVEIDIFQTANKTFFIKIPPNTPPPLQSGIKVRSTKGLCLACHTSSRIYGLDTMDAATALLAKVIRLNP